ncbi:MAG: type II toxin-antitoxin system HicB family antitoxin [Methylobacteriaceae bacterium]|nr:type II toxin-antitoxin system HicB family antitoxin [Methylobacteriaceae bacterium]
MTYYIAILEDEEGKAAGLWFPDVPGCFSTADSVEEAMLNAPGALEAHAEVLAESGQPMPIPRSLSELKADPEVAAEMAKYIVALIPFGSAQVRTAAE